MHWERLAELPLVVEGYALERLEAFERITTLFVLSGAGETGSGEDILPFAENHDALEAAGPYLELAGEWTLESFCEHLATLDQWKPAAAGVGSGAQLAQLGVRVGGAGPRAAPGRAVAARGVGRSSRGRCGS